MAENETGIGLTFVVIDGVFEPEPGGGVRFMETQALDADDAEAVQNQVRRRILRAFVRRGLLEVETPEEDPPQAIGRSPARYLWAMLLARIYEAFPPPRRESHPPGTSGVV